MGKVGTGWNRTTSAEMRRKLDTVITLRQKLTRTIRKPKATWVDPVLSPRSSIATSRPKDCCVRAPSRD
jgi:hypothetical protein